MASSPPTSSRPPPPPPPLLDLLPPPVIDHDVTCSELPAAASTSRSPDRRRHRKSRRTLLSLESEKEEDYSDNGEDEESDDEEGGLDEDDDSWIDQPLVDDYLYGDWDPNGEFVTDDYASHFRTNLKWDTKEELYEWARDTAKALKIVLIKLKSNAYRITMVCERFSHPCPLPAKRIRSFKTKKCSCRFELLGCLTKKEPELDRGMPHENQKWILGVIEGRHNHRVLRTQHGNPFEIITEVKQDFAGNLTKKEQVANFLQKLEYEDRGDVTITQWALKFLVQHDYVIYPLKHVTRNDVEILFIFNKESLHLLKKFPYIVVIDATYKSNKYDYTLVQMVGLTCTHLTFNIGFAFTRAKKTFHFTWIMKKLRAVYEELGVRPTAIMTHREKTLINGINEVFGSEVHHLLCWVHIRNNLQAYAFPILKDATKVKNFANNCWALFCSRSVHVYEERLERIRRSWKSDLVEYLEREWLIPYKKNIVKAWTEDYLHFFTTSNRVEGMHKVMKEIIGSSRGGFNRVIVRVHHAIIKQVDQIKESMNNSLLKKPRDFEDPSIPPFVESIFAPLFYNVSDRCIAYFVETLRKIVKGEFTDDCQDYWVRKCQGLPCIHEVAIAIVEKRPLTPDVVDDFWKKLTWEDSSTSSDITAHANTATHRVMRDVWSSFTSGRMKHATTFQLSDLYTDLENLPTRKARYKDPSSPVKKKGRPPSARNKNGTLARDKNLVEHKEKEVREFQKQKAKEKKEENVQVKQCKTQGQPKKPESTSYANEIGSEELQSQPSLQDWQHHATQEVEAVQPLVHLGVDFGINNVDMFWIPYISVAKDVRSDGHCGYRSLAVLLGMQEREYYKVRHAIAAELIENRDLYDPIRRVLHAATWEQLVMNVNYCRSPCSREFWLHMPFIGLVFATLYQVGLVVLTWHAPTLCLPLRVRGATNGPPTTIMAIAHVGEQDHFIPIQLRDGSPLPQTPGAWKVYGDPNILWWEESFKSNLEIYRTYRSMNERQPNPQV